MNINFLIIYASCAITMTINASLFESVNQNIENPTEPQNTLTGKSLQNLPASTGPQPYHIDIITKTARNHAKQAEQLNTLYNQIDSSTPKAATAAVAELNYDQPLIDRSQPQTVYNPITFAHQDLILAENTLLAEKSNTQPVEQKQSLSKQLFNQIDENFPKTVHALSQTQDAISTTSKNVARASSQATSAFVKKINGIINAMLSKTITLTIKTRMGLISQASLGQVLTISIKHLLFTSSNIPENLKNKSTKSMNNFKKQIQYLAQQITNYNNTTIYKNPDAML